MVDTSVVQGSVVRLLVQGGEMSLEVSECWDAMETDGEGHA